MKQVLMNILEVFQIELRRVFHDKMVILIFFIATLLYPLIFCGIYYNENVEQLPIAVVDEACCEASKRFVHKLDATPELQVVYRCMNMGEAERLMRRRDVHAIFYFPRDFSSLLATEHTAHIGVFCDMSSFYFYKAALLGGNNVLIDEMHTIQLERLERDGISGRQAIEQMQPVTYDNITAYNPSGGYGSFFLPALMVLVMHQTLFLGICILAGAANEHRRSLVLIPPHLRNRSFRHVTVGRALAYLMLYTPITLVDLWFIPRWFHLPQLGNLYNIMVFALPFLLAVIFFAMTIGNIFVRRKITPMLCFVFFSVILFFLSGMVWPHCAMPRFWQAFAFVFPSTPAMQGMVKITSMGAELHEVRFEYLVLWVQAGFYFITATFSLWFIKRYKLYNAMNSLKI